MAHELAVVALDGCMASCVAGVVDILQLANAMAVRGGGAPIFSPRVATPTGEEALAFGGVSVRANASLAALGRIDIVVVPPIVDRVEQSLEDHGEVVAWLRTSAAAGTVLASVCTGAFFIAQTGLLDGRRATTDPGHASAFRRRYPRVKLEPDLRLVDDGAVLSAGATTSFLDLGLHLVERYGGHELAVLTAKVLSIDRNRLSQRPYFLIADQRDHGDSGVLQIQDWLQQHHHESFDIQALSARAAMSVRTLNRRFRAATGESPVSYLHRIRIESAKHLLESTRANIDEITASVGYADSRSFSRLFKRQTGLAPRQYRERFGVIGRR